MRAFSAIVITVFIAVLAVLIAVSCSENRKNNLVGPDSYETCKVTGNVFDFIFWRGLGGVTIIAASCNSAQISGDTFYKTTETDDNGNYSLTGLSEGDYTLKAFKSNYPYDGEWLIGPGEMKITVRDSIVVVDFIAVPYDEDVYMIVGKITNNNGLPVSGVKVKIAGKDTTLSSTSGDKGFFYNPHVKEGETYSLIPEKEGFDYIITPDICYVTVDEHLEICNFSAVNRGEPLHSISGRFVNIDGSPLGASGPLGGSGDQGVS